MINGNDAVPTSEPVLLIDIGNTAIHLAAWHEQGVKHVRSAPTREANALAVAFDEVLGLCETPPRAVVVCSVVPEATSRLRALVDARPGLRFLVIGQDIPLPIPVELANPEGVGIDRVCAAAAAHHHTGHACTVIDFGTAVTVDLVDDRGVFVGGAIFPGAGLQARILNEATAALPLVELKAPINAIGQDTTEAIRSGLTYGIPGAVRALVEKYATVLNQWPQVVATGGDLEWLLPNCDFIDSPVADLTLMGLGLAWDRYRTALSP
jgi:type III pantothenate kinase